MARSRPAPRSRPAARSAPPPAAPKPAAQQQHKAPPQQPNVTNVQHPGMGMGGMGMMGTVASVAMGSVVGHGISNMLFSRDKPPTEPAQADKPPTELAQAQQVAQQYGDGACGTQIKSYSKCMEFNANNSQQCQWAWEMFMQCQDAQPKAGGSA